MISWISGELIELWQINHKFFILLNCQGLGYEIQILEPLFLKLKTNQTSNKKITLWIKLIKKEDSDLLFGFTSKDQKHFFNEILNIRGFGSQIGMGLLNKFSISEIIDAVNTQNQKLIGSVPGIGQKMTERFILELRNKFKNRILIQKENHQDELLNKNTDIDKIFDDLQLTLKSLNYKNKEINRVLQIITKEKDDILINSENISFENLLKLAMNYLENNSSNIG